MLRVFLVIHFNVGRFCRGAYDMPHNSTAGPLNFTFCSLPKMQLYFCFFLAQNPLITFSHSLLQCVFLSNSSPTPLHIYFHQNKLLLVSSCRPWTALLFAYSFVGSFVGSLCVGAFFVPGTVLFSLFCSLLLIYNPICHSMPSWNIS